MTRSSPGETERWQSWWTHFCVGWENSIQLLLGTLWLLFLPLSVSELSVYWSGFVYIVCVCVCVCVWLLSGDWFIVIPWTAARQAPLSVGFSRQEYWSGLPCPAPGDLPDPGIKPRSPDVQADYFPSEPPVYSRYPLWLGQHLHHTHIHTPEPTPHPQSYWIGRSCWAPLDCALTSFLVVLKFETHWSGWTQGLILF